MAEENKDLNKTQSVAETDLNKEQSVAAQDLTASGQGTLADGDNKDKKTVKYTEFEKANAKAKAAEEESASLRQQLAVANANPPAVQAPATQQILSPYDQAKSELGLAEEEFITEADRSKIFQRATEIQNAKYQQQVQVQNNQQFVQSHSDYGEVVGKMVGNQFLPSSELTKILTEKPYLAAAAYASSQGAYEIVMEQRKLDKLQQVSAVQEEHLKQQAIDTKLAPVSGAAAAGGAVNTAGGTVTIAQQQEMERRVAAGEFNTAKG